MKKETLIINYNKLSPGGIETSLFHLIAYSVENGKRVIWLTNEFAHKNSLYKEQLAKYDIEIYFWQGVKKLFTVPKIKFLDDEKIVMFSSNMVTYVIGEQIRYTNKKYNFKHFLAVANFTGNAYYPERYFSNKLIKRYYFNLTKNWLKRIDNDKCLRAYDLKHLESYENHYGVYIDNKNDKILSSFVPIPNVSNNELEEKLERRKNSFVIFACARFDFPHKGFLVGLLDVYKELKPVYPQIKLVIVGSGKGQDVIEEKISHMSEDYRQDIEIKGALSHSEMIEELKKAHLNIGLAGTMLDGGKCAVPSLVCRHYHYSCETYGFFSQNSDKLLDEQKGYDIKPYIKKVIEMSDSSYLQECNNSREVVMSIVKYNPNYLFESFALPRTHFKMWDFIAIKLLQLKIHNNYVKSEALNE